LHDFVARDSISPARHWVIACLSLWKGAIMSVGRISVFIAAISLGFVAGRLAHAGAVGPSPYLSSDDSPFKSLNLTNFQLEDFEDHLLNVPGVTGSPGGVTSVVFGPSVHDSVDADDGAIDGSGLNGDDWFASPALVTFTFDAQVLGGLPTHAGLVWTDGTDPISLEAFDGNGNSLGTVGPVNSADASFNGETAEDRFLGWTDSGGIGSIRVTSGPGGIELDHLQYGGVAGGPSPIPLPPAAWAAIVTLAAYGSWRRLQSRSRASV
jgi:hypothetical protein